MPPEEYNPGPVAPLAPQGAPLPTARANGAAPPEPVSEREVAGILGKLIDGDGDDDTEAAGSTAADSGDDQSAADDIGADESPPTDDDEDDGDTVEPGTERRPAHEPPQSWSAEARAAWAKTPAIVQETYLRRESELNGLATRATQERAETERLALARIDQDTRQYVQNLEVFRGVLVPRAQQYDNVDWQRLAAENPADYVRLQAEAGAVRQQHNAIVQEVVRIQQQVQQETAVRTEQAKREGYRRLVEAIPEFADPQYAQKTGTELGQFLRGWGFSDQEIAACVDDRPLKLALALMNAEKSRAAVQSADRKRVPPPAPNVQRAGNSQPNGQDSKSRRMTQLAARFESSPTVEDAARIVREWMR
jgi:hypothetical protein